MNDRNLRGTIPRQCIVCGGLFYPFHGRETTSNYCSKECYLRSIRLPNIFCKTCGKKILHPRQKSQKYCSRECYYKSKTRRITVQCDWCGISFTRTPSQQKNKGIFCSHKCAYEFSSEYVRGENHHAWRGGTEIKYTGRYCTERKKVLKRANGVCENCHKRPIAAIHHKLPIRFFRNPSDAHFKSNLIALCEICHNKAHKNLKRSLPLLNLLSSLNQTTQ